jgi:ribosomal protein S18 acetylase RimI-like enzyme
MTSLPDEPAIIVRPAVLRDLDALVEIDAICFSPDVAYPRQEIAYLLKAPVIQTVVAERDGNAIGFAALRSFRRGRKLSGDLVTIDVLPQFRRMGVGLQLYSELESRLVGNDASRIELHVSVENAAALNFYRRLGYRAVGQVPNYYPKGIDAWQMEKMLCSSIFPDGI